MIKYRDYQVQMVDDINQSWREGAKVVMPVLPTGGGKTVVFSGILAAERGASVAIAHRQELVGQMSLALARCGVLHRIIAPPSIIKDIIQSHVTELGKSYYQHQARCAVAGVDTLLRRTKELAVWLGHVKLWIVDEGHHLIRGNKWGKATELFPNARGLAVTATPIRASGEGLGRHADGLVDVMVEGPSMRDLITAGWLTDYRVFCPPNDIKLEDVPVSEATGDYNQVKLVNAIRKSHIVGDIVGHYQRIAPGKLAVVFASDVQTATEIAGQFNAAGVVARVVSATTPDLERSQILRDFRAGKIRVLTNCDLFGEGYNLPAIEVVIMARPTESLALYYQQFGRALRPMDGKDKAIIIDHVGNVIRHGLPDMPRAWSLDRRDRKARDSKPDGIPLRTCLNVTCLQVYERVLPACPYCGAKPVIGDRSAPEFVDGDLTELDPLALSRMRREVARVDMSANDYRIELNKKMCPRVALAPNVRRHIDRQQAQAGLRSAIAQWAGIWKAKGASDAESYRRFYHAFGVDVLSAMALGKDDAMALSERIDTINRSHSQ